MPFGLCNAPATFQAYINQAMHGILDVYVIVYMDDILVYSQNEEEHVEHVKAVLARLRTHRLYVKLSKCEFHRPEVKFLGFVVGREGIRMDTDRIETIRDWPEPQSVKDIQMFLGFTGFFRRFVPSYSRVTAPLTEMLKKKAREAMSGRFELTPKARGAFEELKTAFSSPPLMRHFDPQKPILLVTDASGYAVAGIMLQPEGEAPDTSRISDWHPVAYYSQKLTEIERRYEVHDQELLAIVSAFKKWRHYLEGSKHTIRV
jgi:hypothetical protein